MLRIAPQGLRSDEWRKAGNDNRGSYALADLPALRAELARSDKADPICYQLKKGIKKHQSKKLLEWCRMKNDRTGRL